MRGKKVKTRSCAIKFFSLISKVFKLAEDACYLDGYNEYFKDIPVLLVPSYLFVDIDSIFGYNDTHRDDNFLWD